jgi:hypothetical protein
LWILRRTLEQRLTVAINAGRNSSKFLPPDWTINSQIPRKKLLRCTNCGYFLTSPVVKIVKFDAKREIAAGGT